MNGKTLARIAIIVAAIGIFAFAFWRGNRPTGDTPTPTPTPDASSSPVSLPGKLQYAPAGTDWQSYSSTSLGFSVRYPRDWVSSPCGTDCIAFALASQSEELITGISAGTGTLTDLVAQAAPYVLASESLKVSGITWLRLTLQQPQTGAIFTSHFTEHSGKIYEVGISSTLPALLERYASIIRSFAFLKK